MLLSFRSFLRLLCGLSLWQRDIYDAAMYNCKRKTTMETNMERVEGRLHE